jgi:peptidoglycan/xylan/chitin deacetylase (PgdA/CDA1 family)
MKTAALTFDIETDWGGRCTPSRENCKGIEKGLPRIFDILKKHGIKATFFISSETILLFKELYLEIIKQGHEIGSHGHSHNIRFDKLTYSQLLQQMKTSKQIIKKHFNITLLGFRTPQFRINKHHFKALKQAGYSYDSSMVDGKFPGRYKNKISKKPFLENNIIEIPVSVFPYLKVPMGILWINLFGSWVMNLTKQKSIVIYAHPFDFIRKNRKKEYSLPINLWYNFKQKKVASTIEKVIIMLKKRNYRFEKISTQEIFLEDSQ